MEAADRLGLGLGEGGGEAAAVFSVLDDVVSWVERPNAASLSAPPAPPPPPRRGRRGPLSEAQLVGRCLQRLVGAVEADDAAEQREVVQVRAARALCFFGLPASSMPVSLSHTVSNPAGDIQPGPLR